MAVSEGDTISGTLTCAPNAKNPRDLDIGISYKFKGAHGKVERQQNYRMR